MNRVLIHKRPNRIRRIQASNIIEYSEKYLEAWLEQNAKDVYDNPKLAPNFKSISAIRRAQKERLKLEVKMTDKAKVVNRLINKKMNDTEISEIIGITIKGLSDMKLRYDLPKIEEQ